VDPEGRAAVPELRMVRITAGVPDLFHRWANGALPFPVAIHLLTAYKPWLLAHVFGNEQDAHSVVPAATHDVALSGYDGNEAVRLGTKHSLFELSRDRRSKLR
jgi:hypothetical protein